jgi:hypothetical protein
MINMVPMLHRVAFDNPLLPTMYGTHRLYAANAHVVAETNDVLNAADHVALIQRLTRRVNEGQSNLYGDLAALFAGQDWGIDLLGNVAQSDGKLYCYSQHTEELTDNTGTATQVHVGSGQME